MISIHLSHFQTYIVQIKHDGRIQFIKLDFEQAKNHWNKKRNKIPEIHDELAKILLPFNRGVKNWIPNKEGLDEYFVINERCGNKGRIKSQQSS